MNLNRGVLIVVLFALLGCAQVPKESVELSTTVGRDIVEVYRAHRALAVILYDRIKGDINKFVDEVYAPYQIQELLQGEQKDFRAGRESLFLALDTAIKQPNNSVAQQDALNSMDVFVQVLRAEIEFYRAKLLNPVIEQEKQLLSAIDRSYNQIHYANSIVTGHLASIVKVHDAQEELLNEFGIQGLRQDVGENLANVSNKVATIVDKAKKTEETILKTEKKARKQKEELKKNIDDFKNKFDEIFGNMEKKEKE